VELKAKYGHTDRHPEVISLGAQIGRLQAQQDFLDAKSAYIRRWVALYNTLADKQTAAWHRCHQAAVTLQAEQRQLADLDARLQRMQRVTH
jgi:hypothetical protein